MRPALLIALLLAAVLVAVAAPGQAQEVRTSPAGHVPPPATVEALGWLAGAWVGEGIGGAPATEVYSAPGGGVVAGHFVQEDGEGGIAFMEIVQIAEVGGSLVYRLKHFSADLTGWEEKDEMVTFPLVAMEDGALYFDGLTVRRDGADGLVAAVLVGKDDGPVEEYVFTYRRANTDGSFGECSQASTTLEMNQCMADVLASEEATRARYFAAALERESGRDELLALMRRSEVAFGAYRDAECGAVFEDWSDGTVRGAMELSCRIALTRERTHRVWQHWLTYQDSTPPVLPEPSPAR